MHIYIAHVNVYMYVHVYKYSHANNCTSYIHMQVCVWMYNLYRHVCLYIHVHVGIKIQYTCTMKCPVICVVCCSTTEGGMQGRDTTSRKSACSHCSYTISLTLDTGILVAPCGNNLWRLLVQRACAPKQRRVNLPPLVLPILRTPSASLAARTLP